MKNRSILLWLTLGACLLLGWGAFRAGRIREPQPAPAATSPAVVESPPARQPALGSAGATRPGSEGETAPADGATTAGLNSLPKAQLAEIAREREAQYARLVEGGDPMLGEVTQVFAARGMTNAAPVAAGWLLAQRWGVYLRGEEGLKQVEDPIAREELERARRHVLIDAPSQELRELLGGAADDSLLAAIEQVGRRHAPTVLKVPEVPGEDGAGKSRSGRRGRSRPADMEEEP